MRQGYENLFLSLDSATAMLKKGYGHHEQVSLWRQAQKAVPVLALRSAEELAGLEGIIVVIDLRQVSGSTREERLMDLRRVRPLRRCAVSCSGVVRRSALY